MRTTVTIDPDVDALLRKYIRERGLSFKEGINEALRQALLVDRVPPREHMRTFQMGDPRVDIDKALQLAGEMEDAEIIRQMRERDPQAIELSTDKAS